MPDLSEHITWSDWNDEDIYGIRGTCQSWLVCTWALILMFMQTIFWCSQAHILAKLGEIRKIKLSIESGEHAWHFWADNWFKHISQWACELYFCMQGPITRSNWVRSERLRYLWNQGNILDISELQYYPSTQANMHKHYNLAWMDW